MKNKALPLKELSIAQIYNGEKATYEVPIYQRNYAWEKDEISALIQDVHDAYTAKKQTYFIGTLVSFHKGDQVYEVIDGQQRLTTINLILSALEAPLQNKLTYRARKKSNDTIQSIPFFETEEKDYGIINGFKYVKETIDEIVPKDSQDGFKSYFQHSVHLIHYQVPKDIDLNHYFEIMNSRGEQLEKHEIIKARLIEKLGDADKAKFNRLWEYCSEMNVYIQQKYSSDKKSAIHIFGRSLCDFDFENITDFDALPDVEDNTNTLKISDLIDYRGACATKEEENKADTFQPIIDFSNFLLIVLKLTRMKESEFDPASFNLDDKELINEFDKVQVDNEFVKNFGFNLLMAKYLLDNYIVHHSNEDDTIESNPWKLQYWQKENNKGYLKNLDDENYIQNKLVHLLSMFEVSFTPRQRKNYLFYCLFYLFNNEYLDNVEYCGFLSGLADKYFKDIYLMADNLNEINTPKPGSFDSVILRNNSLDIKSHNSGFDFAGIYGDGTTISKGIPLFIFNYLDYKLWEKYFDEFRGKKTKEGDKERNKFFDILGCSDFGLRVFDQFYFSRTRRSLEHYYPQANVKVENSEMNRDQINCFGNYAMIGSEINSSGSNWTPKIKLDHYLDVSGKIKQVSVASIKFMIMMQMCKDNQNTRTAGQEWNYDDIKDHQEKMLGILSSGLNA
ncbi:hypothetical protein EUAN_02510 [Andreesenia angusta]|uniref:DUF262 domain-containing protein n=1 Tax=Andreesenia angusta TaxID=39480 RepID=A0A1S1VAX1_9FIRM|nr:DUF262 domain-containing protein [Andreesenia angusta]OHW63387.1 hypothetical protein EUAN_02510 [Andreesenia angusta]